MVKLYYPEYFYANLLNVEVHENYQTVISDAVANGIKILFPTINKAEYNFKAEPGAIRIGFKAMKGFGEAAQNELQEMNVKDYKDLYEILALPFKKINKAAFQCLIEVGAFDEFGIEREKVEVIRNLYKDPTIEKWFTRDKGSLEISTMPESLLQVKEEQLFEIVEKLKPLELERRKLVVEKQRNSVKKYLLEKYSDDITEKQLDSVMEVVYDEKLLSKKAYKLLGIELEQYDIVKDDVIDYLTSVKDNVVEEVENSKDLPKPWLNLVTEIIPYVTFKKWTDKQRDDKMEEILGFSLTLVENLSKLIGLSEYYPDLNLKSLSAHESEDDLCYWYLVDKTVAKTKTGKDYWILKITDGVISVSAKCWEKIDFTKNEAYVSHIKKDQWGYMIRVDEYLTQVEI